MVERLSLNAQLSTLNSKSSCQQVVDSGKHWMVRSFLISTSGAFGPEDLFPPRRNQTCRAARVSRVRHYSLERR